MQRFNPIILIIVVLIGAKWGTAQTPAPVPPTKKAEPFISLDGGFSIDLPRYFSSFKGVEPVAGAVKGGASYSWTPSDRFFQVSYIDRILTPEDAPGLLSNMADGFIADMAKEDSKLISRREFTVDGHRGLEVTVASSIAIALIRYILVNNRLYLLVTGWPKAEDGALQTKVLNSFTLIDAKAVIAQRLADATPASLPQTPAVKRPRSDAEDEGLKGRVRTVEVSSEDLDGAGYPPGLKTKSKDVYGNSGMLLQNVWYDYRGNPYSVTVYGFLDGKRVALNGRHIDYEYNPPPMKAPPGAVPAPVNPVPADERYSSRYEYKYNENKRLVEKRQFNNRGQLTFSSVYTYEGNRRTVSHLDAQGKETSKALNTYDGKGDLVELRSPARGVDYPDEGIQSYKYLTFDQQGNWTKREVSGTSAKYRGGTTPLHYVEYRTITYF